MARAGRNCFDKDQHGLTVNAFATFQLHPKDPTWQRHALTSGSGHSTKSLRDSPLRGVLTASAVNQGGDDR
jgi:hypothetical protein